jgi:hypothetical protein
MTEDGTERVNKCDLLTQAMHMQRVRYILKNYGLSLTLAGLFLISWMGQAVFQWLEFVNHAEEHDQVPETAAFTHEFLSRTFENWQSEFLQLLTFVVLTTFLIHKGSHESKDSNEEMMAKIKKIEKQLESK